MTSSFRRRRRVSAPAPTPFPASLQSKVAAYLADQRGTYGYYLIDLTSGQSTGLNENLVFPAASTYKLPIAMHVLDEAARYRDILNEELTFTAEDWQDGTRVARQSGRRAFCGR